MLLVYLMGYYYTLTSAASGKPLTVNQSGDLIEKLENCKLDAANHLYTQFSVLSNDFTSRFCKVQDCIPMQEGQG